LVCLLAMMMSLASVSVACAALPGVDSDLSWNVDATSKQRELSLMTQAGVKTTRLSLEWSAVERDGEGVINTGWVAELDKAVSAARSAGLDVLVTLGPGVPYWASSDPNRASGSYNKFYPPRNPTDFADFAGWAASHLGALGVRALELWNEPNLTQFWASGPDPAAFARLIKPAYAAVKAARPDMTVVMGGLSDNDTDFLSKVYAAGGGAGFDVVGMHTYPRTMPSPCSSGSRWEFCGLTNVRNVMVNNGDSAKPIWVTEMGFSTYTGSGGFSLDAQAQGLTEAYKWLESRPWVARAYWYNFRNNYWSNDRPADWDANLGLLRTDFTPKPAYYAYKTYANSATTTAPAPSTTPAPSAVTTGVEGESLALPTGTGDVLSVSGASGGKVLRTWSNATATGSITTPAATTRVVVRAAGQLCDGGPALVVNVDGRDVLSTTAGTTDLRDYAGSAAMTAGTHRVAVRFTNDKHAPGTCDRNLLVDRVSLSS